MFEQIMNPELLIFGGILACGMAVLTLWLAGRAAFVRGLSSRLSMLDTLIEEKRKNLQDLSQKEAETELLQDRNEHLEKRLDALRQDLQPVEEKYHKAVGQYEDIKGKLRQSKEEWREIAERVETYKVRISQIEAIEQELKELGVRHSKLTNAIKQMAGRRREFEQLISGIDQKTAELTNLNAEIDKIKKEMVDAHSAHNKIRESIKQAEENISDQKEEMNKLKVAKVELENEVKGLDESKKRLHEDLKELGERKRELEGLNLSIKEKVAELEMLNTETEKLGKTFEETRKRLQQTKEEIQRTEEKLFEKNAEQDRLQNARIDLDARIETLSDRLKSVGRMPPEAFASLDTPVFDAGGELRANPEEHKALEDLNRLVEYCGFEIPRRLQDAFHTALKTSDISCLTVMAGVSGTGKSAFPKLYAEAMGMNFLPLAVEPRWDSPQDLFGFLNYMENRFEATTLGRALVQFNNSPHAPENASSMSDRVLLVLLDEMNLARIEYYFSEFLSKLEMRRNADISREKDYRMVSVEVFAGHTADKDRDATPPVYLYAGSNVLFVGTMNEDESTQSLSDKVIDRANVLYFGRPNKLRDKHQNIPGDTNWQSMRDRDWQSWIVDPGSESIPSYEEIDSLINSINHTLALLGRPFGWRTYKAIISYIANHPAVRFREDSGLSPFADQIAMRVMPKLRGLDLTEHGEVFSNLGQTLHKVNDADLQQAFTRASQSAQGFFDWRGINWDR